ncbi:hypothetical protein GE061_018826 [Apolygus lucorum]|uniref:Uncharacterized protein n=1 Tax=Apolygus lucorum TaxID=248454 RepID=A0A8S9X9C7_APOLU|nr:hypothetical protein GE061_018826 [Apolygus lucorum]
MSTQICKVVYCYACKKPNHDFSNYWGTPLVPILKADGSIRICSDYKVTLNKFVDDIEYPMPRIEEIFSKLQECSILQKQSMPFYTKKPLAFIMLAVSFMNI